MREAVEVDLGPTMTGMLGNESGFWANLGEEECLTSGPVEANAAEPHIALLRPKIEGRARAQALLHGLQVPKAHQQLLIQVPRVAQGAKTQDVSVQ